MRTGLMKILAGSYLGFVLTALPWLTLVSPAYSQSADPVAGAVETRRYGIEVAGIRVGTMTATRQAQSGQATTYTLVSDVKVNLLVYKLKIYYNTRS